MLSCVHGISGLVKLLVFRQKEVCAATCYMSAVASNGHHVEKSQQRKSLSPKNCLVNGLSCRIEAVKDACEDS